MQSQTQSSCKHPNIEKTLFHDIHKNKFSEYGSSSGDDHDSDNYTDNREVSSEDPKL